MKVTVQLVNAFIDGNVGGNPAGVVLGADNYSTEEKQKIASMLGYSETAFVSESTVADFKLEFFTPTQQIPHCGHATIATFSYLHQLGQIPTSHTSKETIDGVRAIVMRGELAFMEQKPPVYTKVNKWEDQILESLQLTKDQLIQGAAPLVVNTGNSFLLIPIKTQEIVGDIKPHFEKIEKLSRVLGNLIGFYPFSIQTNQAQRDATARMFAPLYGIQEESATGMAAGPLACYLHDVLNIRKSTYFIEQGYLMEPPSPSLIQVDIETSKGSITKLMAGGKGMVMQQKIVAW
ncbi:PhzF family phenazine biosynthesis protein [Rhodocytophaga aerolata]|uniref:PhzF family phenazine biosynthesis protein n=1 Tax=Rhodocytophaga aerolata TaxID=455078 RepID=A0ABT8RFH8_9BACT|nr:PhzF family phenazine biosynthesis protein [Rhodocytophaga aerolata]MDO1450872.1 PhzF family phenazine biosynthesis protein [Rhodocytophaga aerolata]